MKRRIYAVIFLCVFGLLGVLSIMDNPRAAMLHGSDILHLVGSGMCFGAAIGLLAGKRQFPGESPLP